MLPLLGKEQGHHSTLIVLMSGRADSNIQRLTLDYLQNADCCIVKGLAAVELVGFVKNYRCQHLCGEIGSEQRLDELDKLCSVPVIVQNAVLACV